MGNLKDIQDITGLTSEAIFNIRKPVDYMCSDIDSHIKVCCSIWQVCDHYINPNRKHNRKQTTYVRRPSNKACPNYEYGDDNFENRRRYIKEKNTR